MKKRSVIQLASSIGILWGAYFFTTAVAAAVPQKISAFPEGERLIYTRLVQAFRANKVAEVVKQRQVLERMYPNSVHLDNAYYMSGTLEFQNGRYTDALKAFDVVRDKHLKSNKRPSAMFAIAMTYQRLNLPKQAHRVFEKIIAEYPGSQESQRAWMNMRMGKDATKTQSVKK